MPETTERKIIDLEWPTRYLLECGHAIAIAPDTSAAEMVMPGAMLPCPECSGAAAPAVDLVMRFKAGEAINAISLNSRLQEIERHLRARGRQVSLTRFTAEEPVNAQSLNIRLDEISLALA